MAKPTVREQVAALPAQSQADVKELAALIRANTEWARDKYIALAAERGWTLAEASVIKSFAFELSK